MKLSPIAQNGIIVLVSSLLALIVAEGVVRLVEPEAPFVLTSDPYLGQKVERGQEYDVRGWRNKTALARADIIAIGDSMTNGQGASREEAWPQVLEALSGHSVYQMALGGYGPVQYAHLVETARALNPKLVVVGLYLGNDLYDAYDTVYHTETWTALRSPQFVDPNQATADREIRLSVLAGAEPGSLKYQFFVLRSWLRDNIRLYALLGNATRALRERFGLVNSEDERLKAITALSEQDPNIAYVYDAHPEHATVLSPLYRADAVNLGVASTQEGWRITKDRLLAMREALGDTKLLIVAIPTKELVYLKYMRMQGEPIPPVFVEYEWNEQEILGSFHDFCIEKGLHCTDLLDELAGNLVTGKTLFKPILDGHPRPEGYAAFAAGINGAVSAFQL